MNYVINFYTTDERKPQSFIIKDKEIALKTALLIEHDKNIIAIDIILVNDKYPLGKPIYEKNFYKKNKNLQKTLDKSNEK